VTTGVLNYPRRPLSERERTIREAIERFDGKHPYRYVPIEEYGSLQGVIDELTSGDGGTVWLDPGNYGGFTVRNSGNVTIRGASMNTTIITGAVSAEVGYFRLQDLTIRATDLSIGLNVFKSGGDTARCELQRVYIGGTADNSNPPVRNGDGPATGMVLDGTIVATFDHCTFAYCDSYGVNIDTSSATYSTNVNTFRDCAFNGNGIYGVYMTQGGGIAGMMLHKFEGGNMENNDSKDFWSDSATFIIIDGVDFETAKSHVGGEIIYLENCQPAIIRDCNFVVGSGKTVTRFFHMAGCMAGRVERCRLSGAGTWAAGAVGLFNEDCVQCTASDNILHTAGFGRVINNRGSMFGVAS